MEKINAQGTEITISLNNGENYISLTDIAKKVDTENPRFIIQNWLRNRSTIDFLGVWGKNK